MYFVELVASSVAEDSRGSFRMVLVIRDVVGPSEQGDFVTEVLSQETDFLVMTGVTKRVVHLLQ